MKIVTDDLWGEVGRADVILVTTNTIINSQGKLVMGRGAAYEAALRYPSLPRVLAEKIKGQADPSFYGVIILEELVPGYQVGAFQVKIHWKENARLGLVRRSTAMLKKIAEEHSYKRFAMNYPGIGNGRLSEEDVFSIIATLPDNVFVYKKP